jgi:hypothetical protein
MAVFLQLFGHVWYPASFQLPIVLVWSSTEHASYWKPDLRSWAIWKFWSTYFLASRISRCGSATNYMKHAIAKWAEPKRYAAFLSLSSHVPFPAHLLSLLTGGDWYVSNVSIIFDALCLFIHHLIWVLLHFMVFYVFSGTNLLTRCHSASFLFSAVFVFQKSYTGNILGIGQNKSRTSYFYRSFAKTEDETEGVQEPGSPQGGRGPAPGRATPWWGQLTHLLMMPFRL